MYINLKIKKKKLGVFENNLYFCTESGKNKYIDNICPRKVRERSERNPKGKIGGACSGLISPKVEKINILIIYAPRKVRERSERNPKGKFKTNKYERIRRRRGKTS